MSVGEHIKEARNLRNMTQKELADKVSLAEITIRKYEANQREPKIDMLQRIADALDVTISFLLGQVDDPHTRMAYADEWDNPGPGATRAELDDLAEHEKQRQPKRLTINTTPDPEWIDLDRKLMDGTITTEELERYKELLSLTNQNLRKILPEVEERKKQFLERIKDASLEDLEKISKMIDIILEKREDPSTSPPDDK